MTEYDEYVIMEAQVGLAQVGHTMLFSNYPFSQEVINHFIALGYQTKVQKSDNNEWQILSIDKNKVKAYNPALVIGHATKLTGQEGHQEDQGGDQASELPEQRT